MRPNRTPERHHDNCARPLDDSHVECPIRHDLCVDAEAFMIVASPVGKSKTRRVINGTARVRVVDAHVDGRHNVYRVVVIAASSGVVAGREIEARRGELYNCNELVECQAFREEIARFWPTRQTMTTWGIQ